MSGAGRSSAAKVLEDLGYSVIDNLPPQLIAQAIAHHEVPERRRRLAVVIDSRGGDTLEPLTAAIDELDRQGVLTRVLFLEAEDGHLVTRYEENRRPHPLRRGSLTESIAEEREMLAEVKEAADVVIDTTDLNIHQLRNRLTDLFAEDNETRPMRVSLTSFGYKHGPPRDADLIFDVRFLPNPHWVKELRPLLGTDPPVRDYVFSFPEAGEFLTKVEDLLSLPHPPLRGRGKELSRDRDRLHRWPSPFDCPGRGTRSLAQRAGNRRHGPSPRRRTMTATIPATQLEELVYNDQGPRVVALGGGHGLSITLKAVQSYASEITAVVSVADDGGSSGRLTYGLGVAPPGDVRRCLLALTPDHTLWSEVFGYRFAGGDIEDHSLGNLLLAALTDITGDFVSAVEAAGRMLKTVGRVIPVADRAAVLSAVAQGNQIEGQAEITKARGIEQLTVGPPEITAHPAALEAIAGADQLILGPGSLYTSLMSVLLIPGIKEAWEASGARKVFVLNLIGQDGETMGMSGRQHLEALGLSWWYRRTGNRAGQLAAGDSPRRVRASGIDGRGRFRAGLDASSRRPG